MKFCPLKIIASDIAYFSAYTSNSAWQLYETFILNLAGNSLAPPPSLSLSCKFCTSTCEFADCFAVARCHYVFRHKWISGITSYDFNEADDRRPQVRKFDILERARSLSWAAITRFILHRASNLRGKWNTSWFHATEARLITCILR